MGIAKDYGHEPAVLNAIDQFTHQAGVDLISEGEYWKLAYWMPHRIPSAMTWKQWHQRYGKAKKVIQRCCSELASGIDSPSCGWTPLVESN